MASKLGFLRVKDIREEDENVSPLTFLRQGQNLRVDASPDTRRIAVDSEEARQFGIERRARDYADKFFTEVPDETTGDGIINGLIKRVSQGDEQAKANIAAIRTRYGELAEEAEAEAREQEERDQRGFLINIGSDVAEMFSPENIDELPGNLIRGVQSTFTKAGTKLSFAFGLENHLHNMMEKGDISEDTYLKLLEDYSEQAGLDLRDDTGWDIFRKSVTNFGEIAFDAATLGTSVATTNSVSRALRAAKEGSAAGVLNSMQGDELTAADMARGGIFGAVAGGGLAVAIPLPFQAIKKVSADFSKPVDDLMQDGFTRVDMGGEKFVITPDLGSSAKAEVAKVAKEVSPSTIVKETPINQVFEEAVGRPQTIAELVTPFETGGALTQDQLVRQLTQFVGDTPDDALIGALSKTDLSLGGDINFWLRNLGETTGVAGRYLGKYGTDSVYMMSRGAKTVADIQELVGPVVHENTKLMKKAAKSDIGRKEVQQRVFLALGDRENAGKYLRSEVEQQLFENTQTVFDFFTQKRQELGLNVVGQNYRPEIMMREAIEAPEKMFDTMRNKFGTDLESPFSKERIIDTDIQIENQIIDLLPQYVASQAREFGYKPAMDFMLDNVDSISLVNQADKARFSAGKDFLANLIAQSLNHTPKDGFTRLSNSLLANTYKSILGWRPKFAMQNMTQRFLSKTEVSAEAGRVYRSLPENVITEARKNINTGLNPLTGEFEAIARKTKKDFDPAFKTEEGNVTGAFDMGFAQGILDSPAYQEAISSGVDFENAVIRAANDTFTFEQSIRHGNKVVNDTQFGANQVTKPQFFREKRLFNAIPDVWFKQFRRFTTGMNENLSRVMHVKNTRALDILKVGDPRYTPIVEYRDAAKLLSNSADDVITAIKNGEIQDVPLDYAQSYKGYLDQMIGDVDTQIKEISQFRGGRAAKAYIKMWVALAGIQFLADGGLFADEDETQQKTTRAVLYGAPIDVPFSPRAGGRIDVESPFQLAAPSSPISPRGGVDVGNVLNFIPGIGLVYNRYQDAKNFFNID